MPNYHLNVNHMRVDASVSPLAASSGSFNMAVMLDDGGVVAATVARLRVYVDEEGHVTIKLIDNRGRWAVIPEASNVVELRSVVT